MNLTPVAENIPFDEIKPSCYDTKNEKFKEFLHQVDFGKMLTLVAENIPSDRVKLIS